MHAPLRSLGALHLSMQSYQPARLRRCGDRLSASVPREDPVERAASASSVIGSSPPPKSCTTRSSGAKSASSSHRPNIQPTTSSIKTTPPANHVQPDIHQPVLRRLQRESIPRRRRTTDRRPSTRILAPRPARPDRRASIVQLSLGADEGPAARPAAAEPADLELWTDERFGPPRAAPAEQLWRADADGAAKAERWAW